MLWNRSAVREASVRRFDRPARRASRRLPLVCAVLVWPLVVLSGPTPAYAEDEIDSQFNLGLQLTFGRYSDADGHHGESGISLYANVWLHPIDVEQFPGGVGLNATLSFFGRGGVQVSPALTVKVPFVLWEIGPNLRLSGRLPTRVGLRNDIGLTFLYGALIYDYRGFCDEGGATRQHNFAIRAVNPPYPSCPFVFVDNGEEYVFDAEPFAGAVLSAAARDDHILLRSARASDGVYRMRVANLLEEVDYIDALSLVVVDHSARDQAVFDVQGQPRLVRDPAPAIRATDGAGRDIAEVIAADDDWWWHSEAPGAGDSRIHDRIRLRFRVPKGADRAVLLFTAKNTTWSTAIAQQYAERFGAWLGLFWRLYERVPGIEKRLERRMRKEGAQPELLLRVGSKWKHVGYLYEVGPRLERTQALRFELPRRHRGEIELQLVTGRLLWDIDQVALAVAASPATRVTEIRASKASAAGVADARGRVRRADHKYIVLNKGETLEAEFVAPPLARDSKRSVFLKANGFYRPIQNSSVKLLTFLYRMWKRDLVVRYSLSQARVVLDSD